MIKSESCFPASACFLAFLSRDKLLYISNLKQTLDILLNVRDFLCTKMQMTGVYGPLHALRAYDIDMPQQQILKS